MESADGTSIHTDRLASTWRVDMKRKDNIKDEGGSKIRGWGKSEKNNCSILESDL